MDKFRIDLLSSKPQEVKLNAFFQYLRSFSQTGLETLHKLEDDFKAEMKQNMHENEVLIKMKQLLASYQIFVLEMKDSCDFVDIPEFGFCIGKTFMQFIKMIKWILRYWMKSNEKKIKSTKEKQCEDVIEQKENKQQVCQFCQEIIRNPFDRDQKMKRKGMVKFDMEKDLRMAKNNHFNEKNQLMSFKDIVLEKINTKETVSKKNIPGYEEELESLNRRHLALKMEISNNQTVLEEVLNQFSLKTEAMSKFVMNTQAICIEGFKINYDQEYESFLDDMKIMTEEKVKQAKQKFKKILDFRIYEVEQQKKSKLINKQTQTNPEVSQKDKHDLRYKELQNQMRSLRNQLECERKITQSLKALLGSKSIEFEEEFLNFRKEHIGNQSKSRANLKSLATIRDFIDENSKQSHQISENNSIMQISEKTLKIKDDPALKIKNKKVNHGVIIISDKGYLNKQSQRQVTVKFTGVLNDSSEDNQQKQNNDEERISAEMAVEPRSSNLGNEIGIQTNSYQIQHQRPYQCQNCKVRANKSGSFSKAQQKRMHSATSEKKQMTTYEKMLLRVKPRVYDYECRKVGRKPFMQKKSQQMGNLVHKLVIQEDSPQNISIHKVNVYKLTQQPLYSIVKNLIFSEDDITNLFLNQKNAQNYQCLTYRNSIFSVMNINPKRILNNMKNLQISDAQWNYKDCNQNSHTTQLKIANYIFYQINLLRKKEKHSYHQLKHFLRYPCEYTKRVNIVMLKSDISSKGGEDENKDIEFSEVKKMMNLIWKLHEECLSEYKKNELYVCEHLMLFCQRIGIKMSDLGEEIRQ